MGHFTHLLLTKFKEGVVAEDIAQEIEKLVSESDCVESFVWGKDDVSMGIVRRGFTHAFLMTFKNKEDFSAFIGNEKHPELAAHFQSAAECSLIFDFQTITVKAPPPAADAS